MSAGMVKCPKCNGTGEDPFYRTRQKTCPLCKGKGKVTERLAAFDRIGFLNRKEKRR